MGVSEDVLTREEVREKLAERTESISSRLEAIESELPLKAKVFKRLSEHRRLLKRTAAVGAGVLVIAAIIGRRRTADTAYRDGIERIARAIAREIKKNMKAGMETEDAVSSALKKRPPVLKLGGGSKNESNSGVAALVLRQLVLSLGPAIVELIADRLRNGSDK